MSPFEADELRWGDAPSLVIAANGSEWHVAPILLAGPPFLSFGYTGGGMLTRTPPASEVPLPATGTGSPTTMVAIAASLLLAGSALLVSARVRRR